MLNVPSGLVNQPSNAGVMLAPRSRCGSSGSALRGGCAFAMAAAPATIMRLAASTQRSCLRDVAVLIFLTCSLYVWCCVSGRTHTLCSGGHPFYRGAERPGADAWLRHQLNGRGVQNIE